ncbi:MAG: hypothetical protein II453_14930 [Alphaproteobacteria bacterium]|nr:hypothetical protein [Alphaproteobacteria bacterium]
MAENAMTPADMGAVLGNRWGGYPYGGSGFGFGGGDGGLFAILLIVLLLGGSGAWGMGGRGQFGTEAIQNQMQQGFDNQNNMANQREILGATNQVYHDLTGYIGDKYAELDRDVLSIGSTLQQVMANQNQCCCSTLRAIDGVNYANAQNTAAINANTTEQVQKVLDAISANKIEALQGRINQLELNNAVAGVVRYPTTFSYNAGQSPFCSGCGCGF